MSIIIHFTPASTLLSPSTVPPAPACVVDAETALQMGPGLENDSGLSVMSPDDSSMVDVSTTDLYSGKEKLHISGAHHTLSSCFGLPYQDHNYGAPPPPTPPNHSPQMSPVHVVNTVVKTEPVPSLPPTVLHTEEVTETSVTRCVCGFEHDDEYMICCDRCLVWQHVDCMGLDRNKIPETYLCEKCEPRKVDRQKAKVLQAKKKVAMTGKKLIFHETSDESEEDRNEKNQSVESLPKTRSKSSRRKTDDDKEVKMEHAARKGRSNSKQCKERMEIKRSKFRRRTKSKSESACVGDEEAQDAWKCSADWSKRRDDNSGSSGDVHNLGATLRSQTDEMKVSKQLQAQLCRLVEFAGNQKKLVAVTDLSRDQIIIEFKGQFLSATQFHQKNPVYRQKQFPFVLFYKLRSHEELCVDASEYGNEARFVRRSCMPNAEIRHLVSNGALHLYISSIKEIHKDEEITIPFDVNFKDCLHEVDCACNSDMCFISGRKNGGSDSNERKRRTRKHPHSTDDDSNHSLLGSVPSSPVKSSKISPVKVTSPTKVSTPVMGVLPEQSEIRMSLDDTLSEEHIKEQRKKMTREERKLDAIMRAFDQMEKAAKRKQQALDRQAQQKALQKPDDLPEKQELVSSSVIKEEEKQNITENSSSIDDEKPEKPVVVAQPVKHKKGKRRRGSGTPVRRRTRTNSGGSDIFNTDENTSNCESASLPSTPSVETPESAFSESASTSLTPSPGSVTPVLPKTKRFLHNEWLHEKESNVPVSSPLTVRTEINYNVMVTTPACYVRCTKDSPSASGISAAHLRRSSLAGHGKLASSVGSAKKRWLRQAMYDCEPGDGDSGGISMEVINGEVSSPSHAICFSPTNHCEIGSPGIVASEDVVTPLKKRRLMRKSVESVSSSEWLGASSELSPDHSSCDSTVDGSAESMLVANISVELKCSNSTEKQDEKCSASGRNGLSQHLLKTLRQNWIKNDNKSKVTDSLNIDENAQNIISDGNVNSVTKNSDPEIKNVTLPGFCSEGNSALKEGDTNAKQRDFKSVFEVKDDKSSPNENSVEERNNAIHSESISIPVLNQESKKKLEFSKGDLSADSTETDSVKIVIPDNLKDKNLSSNATTNVSLSNVPEASDKEPPVAELSGAGSAVLSSLTTSQQLPNSQNKVRTGEGICDNKAISDCVVKISKEDSSICDSTSNLNLKGKEKDLTKESNDAQDTTYFQKLSSDIDSTSVSIGTTDSLTTVSVPTACASKVNLLKLGTVVVNDKDTLGSKLLSPLSTEKISLGENVNESPNKSSSPTSASTTPKRKVSLSEYWQRKRENPTNNSGSFEKKKSNNCMLNSMGSLEIASESEIKLASLPLFQSIITSKEQSSTEEGKGTKKKDSTSFGGERKTFLEARENLTERLKREFGLEEETELTKSDNESKCPKSESGSLKVASDIAPILSLCSQLPPPPPPPAPPGGAPVNNKSPSPSQFNYPVATPFAPQPYVISQVNASQYMTAQSPMVPQIIPVIHPMTVSSATQPPCNYSATMQTSVARPPQPTYPVVNNQNYTVLAQPLPHTTLQPTYHPLFKSRVYK